jgi:hypothetical protein
MILYGGKKLYHQNYRIAEVIMETLNAQIKSTKLGFVGNDILTFDLILDIQDGGGVCVGGYALSQYDKTKQKIVGTAQGTSVIMRILEVVGVDTWEELKGKYIRIKDCHLGDRVSSIGNLMKNEWVDFDNFEKENF